MLNNIQIFFSALILIFFIGMLINIYKDKSSLINLLALFIIGLIIINRNYWFLSLLGILLIFVPIVYKKISYNNLMTYSMIGSILGAYFILMLYLNYNIPALMLIISITLIIMCILSVFGILEQNIKKYLIYSNLIQFLFILLDLSVAKSSGKIGSLGIIQIFNYTIAGTLLFVTLIILNKEKFNLFKDIQGYYYKDKATGLFAVIASASLAGLPGLNIFVSEWLLFVKGFAINPVITILGIFIALLLLIMYFKVIYILVSGPLFHKEKFSIIPRIYNGILSLACLLFGILPFLQFYIFTKVLT